MYARRFTSRVPLRSSLSRIVDVSTIDDPAHWDRALAESQAATRELRKDAPENWPPSRQIALLRIQRSDAARDCIAHSTGIYATENDFAFLRKAELAVRPLGQRYHQLTPEGIRVARDLCFVVAKRLGLHHVSYVMDSYTEHKVRCTCGWHQSLNRRNNNGAVKYLQERAARHLGELGVR